MSVGEYLLLHLIIRLANQFQGEFPKFAGIAQTGTPRSKRTFNIYQLSNEMNCVSSIDSTEDLLFI